MESIICMHLSFFCSNLKKILSPPLFFKKVAEEALTFYSVVFCSVKMLQNKKVSNPVLLCIESSTFLNNFKLCS